MATQSVPVPASVAEQLAESALEQSKLLDKQGYSSIAQDVQESAGLVLQQAACAGGGEFISVSGSVLSQITAHRSTGVERNCVQCATHFLKQYDVWD
jgi:hypothetical protein